MLLDMTLLENRRADGHQLYFYQQKVWAPIKCRASGANVAQFQLIEADLAALHLTHNFGYN